MKISGKFILKVAGTLTVISLITAFLLGLVNGVTKDKIAAIEAEKTRVAMSAVVPEGSEFTDALEIPQAAIDAAKAQGGTVGFMRMGLNMKSRPTAIVGKRVVVVGGGFAGLEVAEAM